LSQILKPKQGYKFEKWFFGKEIEIPQEWELVNFGRFTNKITYGFTNPMPTTNDGAWMITATNIKNGKIIYEKSRKTSWNAYNNLITIKSRPKKGLILITKDGTLGEVAIVDRDNICINQSVASIEYDNSKISSDYLLLSLQSKLIKQFIDIFSPQTTIRHIYITDIPNWKIPLPSLQEQQKIASILSNIDNLIINTQKIIDQTKSVKKGLMQKLLIKGIGHTKFKKVIFGRYFINYSIPIDWKIVKLGKIFNFKNGVNKEKSFFGKGTPIVNVLDVYGNSGLTSNQIKGKVTLSENEIISFKLKKDDVVFTRTSETIEDIGTSSVILDDVEKTTFSGFLLRAQPKTEDFEINFKKFSFSSNIIRKQIISTGTKTSRALTTKNYLSNVIIPIPPLPEQKKIASILSNADSQITSQTQYKEKLEKLKKSLMQKLLTGRVRVAI